MYSVEVLEENNYYPFGLKHEDTMPWEEIQAIIMGITAKLNKSMNKIKFFFITVTVIFIHLQSCSSPSENYKKKMAEKEIKLWLQRRHIYHKPITFIVKKAPNEANVEYFDYFVGNVKDSLILSYGFNEDYLESGYIEIVPNKNMEQLLNASH